VQTLQLSEPVSWPECAPEQGNAVTGRDQAVQLAPAFNPKEVEQGLYDQWDAAGYFQPSDRTDREPFVVIMPPPNVTGELHIGHALFVTIQDIMVRYHRMLGDPTLWLPGADHAGIAGQWVVERLIAKEGLTRHDLGRERFLERVWQYMDQYRGRIREQMRILGASCDWSRFTFTMDPGPSRAVRRTFKHLYDKGMIYRGERLISWCPRCNTALSDLEVIHRDVKGHLWHISYPVVGSDERVVVATTRPETMLGDTAVAVHPDDERYQHLIGKMIRLPIMDRMIPIVADDAVDSSFGSGAVKVTPAHDPNDFEIGRRHDLPFVTVMNLDGTMNAEAGPFEGLTIDDARVAVVKRLEQDGFLVKTENHEHSVGHCERCGTVVQPLISKQWFVRMDELAAPAIAAAKDGSVQFVPERFKGVYLNWMENIRDWTVSRQLWWGHRIPVWYRLSDGQPIVSEVDIDVDPETGEPVEQDPDVLDTWFSSGLWPFSTLGWPDETEDLKRFYPSSVMETGYEILFFWVARMVFFGIEMMGEPPFHTVYLHGTVRDAEGLKMSKTKGNVLDPTEITEEYGADALRFALATQGSAGIDSRLSLGQVESSRNFINKLWNATRFAMGAIHRASIEMTTDGPARPTANLSIVDRWILSRTDAVTAEMTRLLDTHQYGEAGRQLREFIWSEFCDWYIEAAKVRLRGEQQDVETVAQTLAYAINRILRLLHPYAPFVTATLWQVVPNAGAALIVSDWPRGGESDPEAVRLMGTVIELVTKVRNARSESNVEPGRWIAAHISSPADSAALESLRGEISFLARIANDQLTFSDTTPAAHKSDIVIAVGDVVAVLPMAGLVDLEAERVRIEKELANARGEIERLTRQLSNPNFVERAPEKLVTDQRTRLALVEEQVGVLTRRLADLSEVD
jgi:valyl-tRNA synthetase